MPPMQSKEIARKLINDLGGVAKTAERLGVSVQRVNNWMTRGIPAQIKVDHPALFMPELAHPSANRPSSAIETGPARA